jgi:D-alanyl-D-alanine carboxypeptidase
LNRTAPLAAKGLAAALGLAGAAAAPLLATAEPGPATAHAPVVLASNDSTAGLDPALAQAYLAAQADASRAGVTLWITSGARSPEQQRAMWEDGLATHGSPEAARRWVLPPEESKHVSGDAIDVGPAAGAQWLEQNGSRYGLCRIYDNEWWHFELATAPGGTCPPRLPNASVARPTPQAPVPGTGSMNDVLTIPGLPDWLRDALAGLPAP